MPLNKNNGIGTAAVYFIDQNGNTQKSYIDADYFEALSKNGEATLTCYLVYEVIIYYSDLNFTQTISMYYTIVRWDYSAGSSI